MTKLGPISLRNAIEQEEFDYPLLTSVLAQYSGVRQKINELLKAGVIVRVKKGLYTFGPQYNRQPVCKEALANLIYGPSCISLEYALAFHGFIPERVDTITSVTPKRDKEFVTPLGRFTYRYLSMDKYAHGIEQVWIDSRHPILIASPEKALCDYIVLHKIGDITDGVSARQFLFEDLRMDESNISRLNPGTLLRLNKAYRSKSIKHILEVL